VGREFEIGFKFLGPSLLRIEEAQVHNSLSALPLLFVAVVVEFNHFPENAAGFRRSRKEAARNSDKLIQVFYFPSPFLVLSISFNSIVFIIIYMFPVE
jgi:hypothetical protein